MSMLLAEEERVGHAAHLDALVRRMGRFSNGLDLRQRAGFADLQRAGLRLRQPDIEPVDGVVGRIPQLAFAVEHRRTIAEGISYSHDMARLRQAP